MFTSVLQDAERTVDSEKAYNDFVAGLELINQQEYISKDHTAGKDVWDEANWERLIKQRKNSKHGALFPVYVIESSISLSSSTFS